MIIAINESHSQNKANRVSVPLLLFATPTANSSHGTQAQLFLPEKCAFIS